MRPKYGTFWFGATTAVPTLTVKNFEVAAHEPPLSRTQNLPTCSAAVAEPQNRSAFLPSTFVCPGVQAVARARAPAGRGSREQEGDAGGEDDRQRSSQRTAMMPRRASTTVRISS